MAEEPDRDPLGRQQPHKPGGEIDEKGNARDAGDLRAVENQGQVTPDDYPADADGKWDLRNENSSAKSVKNSPDRE